MQEYLWILLGLSCVGALGYIGSGKGGNVRLSFGIIDIDDTGAYYIEKETTHIPLYPNEHYPDFRFGYILEYTDERHFVSYFTLRLPKPPKLIGGSLQEGQIHDLGREITSVPIFYQNDAVEAFCFNESDPIGKWSLDIYVNETLLRTIPFTVVPMLQNSSQEYKNVRE